MSSLFEYNTDLFSYLFFILHPLDRVKLLGLSTRFYKFCLDFSKQGEKSRSRDENAINPDPIMLMMRGKNPEELCLQYVTLSGDSRLIRWMVSKVENKPVEWRNQVVSGNDIHFGWNNVCISGDMEMIRLFMSIKSFRDTISYATGYYGACQGNSVRVLEFICKRFNNHPQNKDRLIVCRRKYGSFHEPESIPIQSAAIDEMIEFLKTNGSICNNCGGSLCG